MLLLLPLLLLISSVFADPPTCPEGINEDDTFNDGNFYYQCHSGTGHAQGCMTPEGEVIAFGEKAVLSRNQNGEYVLNCWKKETKAGFEYGRSPRFDSKPDDQLLCSNGKKIGEQFVDAKGFVHRCNITQYGGDWPEVIGCLARDNKTVIAVGQNRTVGRIIERCILEGNVYSRIVDLLPEVPCKFNGKEYAHNERFTLEDKFIYRCAPDEDGNAQVKFLNCKLPNGIPVSLGKSQKYQGKAYTCKSETELVVE